MIKLIACDLDGTLLPPDKIMPKETFGLIEEFHSLGGVFAPASGRQLPNLLKLFAPVKDKIAVIAENGGLVWYKGEVIFTDSTPAKDIKRALDIIANEEHLFPLLSCPDCAYYESGYPPFEKTLQASYSSYMRVKSLQEIAGDVETLKISVWDELPAATHGGKILPPKIEGLRTMISGRDWLDVSIAHANKGRALNELMKRLNVQKAECAAFGDHMNDYEMLLCSGEPYVTANAFPALKEKIGQIIPPNAEFGVIQKMQEIIRGLNSKNR